jgi:type IV pilus biogenesis protein CpaD/CtpE
MPGFGCSDSYNMGQMLARPRDAAVGRPAGPADATINALAIARYREGRVAALSSTGTAAAGTGGGGGGSPPPSN